MSGTDRRLWGRSNSADQRTMIRRKLIRRRRPPLHPCSAGPGLRPVCVHCCWPSCSPVVVPPPTPPVPRRQPIRHRLQQQPVPNRCGCWSSMTARWPRRWSANGVRRARDHLTCITWQPTRIWWRPYGASDAVVFPFAALGELIQAKAVRPFPPQLLPAPAANANAETVSEYRWNDLLPLLRREELRWGKSIYGVPFGSPQLVLLYRRDVLQQRNLTAPTTWAQYQTLLEQLRGQMAEAGAASGLPRQPTVEPLGPGWAARSLLARAAAYARHPNQYSTLFHFTTMKPLINQPPFVRALQELVESAQYQPAEAVQMSPAQATQQVLCGQSLMAIGWPSAAADLPHSDSPQNTRRTARHWFRRTARIKRRVSPGRGHLAAAGRQRSGPRPHARTGRAHGRRQLELQTCHPSRPVAALADGPRSGTPHRGAASTPRCSDSLSSISHRSGSSRCWPMRRRSTPPCWPPASAVRPGS